MGKKGVSDKEISDREFVGAQDTEGLLKYEDIGKAFWDYSELLTQGKLSDIGKFWIPFTTKPAWTAKYDASSVRAKAKNVADRTQTLSAYYHALGIMDYFPDHPMRHFSKEVEKSVNQQFKDTLFTLFHQTLPRHCFTQGYYNIGFQKSLLESLIAFSKQEENVKDPLSQKILQASINNFEKSIAYYEHFSARGSFPKKQIISDLASGETRMFSTGRNETENFHATNIIINNNYLIICDRFDVDRMHYPSSSTGMISLGEPKLTGRNPESGIYVYRLPKGYAKLTKYAQEKLYACLTDSMTKEQSLFELHRLLDLSSMPTHTVRAKMQTKGSCRYAAKKQGAGGLFVSAALSLVNDSLNEKDALKHASILQKQFKSFDRLYKIDKLIVDKQMLQEEKDQLLILTLLRNFDPRDPDKETDVKIFEKITDYFTFRLKEGDEFNLVLSKIFTNLSSSLKEKAEIERLNQIMKRLNNKGIKMERP